MSKLTDAELQALVYQTGITPVDKLPKPDPQVELKGLLHHISNVINGAVKAGDPVVQIESTGFPKWSDNVIISAEPILTQLGYRVTLRPMDVGVNIVISGWL